MHNYVILLRGINVGGKNKLPMAELRKHLESLGFQKVETYIASGNVLLQTELDAQAVQAKIETSLPKVFQLESKLIKVLVLNRDQLRAVVKQKPKKFGDEPELYHSDVIFLMGISSHVAYGIFKPRDGVDKIWEGPGVIYSQRLSAERTKSRLSKIMGTAEYQSMTIRTWRTVTTLLERLEEAK